MFAITRKMSTFLPIPGIEGYTISSHGSVRNEKTGRILQTSKTDGYERLNLCRKSVAIHRLVAFAWLPPPLEGQNVINHRDGNPLNNDFENLEWCTQGDNVKHAYESGLIQRKTRPGRKIKSVDADGNAIHYLTIKEASRALKVSYSSIHKALDQPLRSCKGFRWQTIEDNPDPNLEEEWKELREYEEHVFDPPYAISSFGRIKGQFNLLLHPSANKRGYLQTALSPTIGPMKSIYVHRLVASAFLGPQPNPDYIVDHIDGNKSNNAASNLCWLTKKENTTKAIGIAIEQRTLEGILVAEFPSIAQAARTAEVPLSSLHQAIAKAVSYKGFIWSRAVVAEEAQ